MSGYTMTQGELLYSCYTAATVSTPSTTAVQINAAMPVITVPSMYLTVLGKASKSLHLQIGALMSTSSAGPTWTFSASYTTSDAYSNTNTLFTTAAATATSSITGAMCFWDVTIGIRTLAPGAASTVVAMGQINSPAALASPFAATVPATGSNPFISVWDTELTYYIWPQLALSAATAGNTLTVQYVKLYGEN
jgi:hypothetical protein